MDTNLMNSLLLEAMKGSHAAVTPAATWGNTLVLLFGMLIAAIPPTLMSLAAFHKAKVSTETTANTNRTAHDTAEAVEKVHQAVNSERTAMLAEVKNLRLEILRLSMANSSLVEKDHGKEIRDALATVAVPIAVPLHGILPSNEQNPLVEQVVSTPEPVLLSEDQLLQMLEDVRRNPPKKV